MKFLISNFQFLIWALVLGVWGFPPQTSYAASLYFAPAVTSVGVGGEFKTSLMLDAEGEELNAIQTQIKFPTDLLALRASLTGESIIGLWIGRPEQSGGEINMAGIIPGGFSGVIDPTTGEKGPGPLASFVFTAKEMGQGSISVSEASVTLGDGRGTLAETHVRDLEFLVSSAGATSSIKYDYNDTKPPEPFEVKLVATPELYSDKYVLIFETRDAQSGIDHYEVKEGNGEFTRAESPYLLADQNLSSIIYVRAIDLAGNERTASFDPRQGDGSPVSAGFLLAVVLALISYIIWRLITKKH